MRCGVEPRFPLWSPTLISNVSANGLHYSWDWDDLHFIQLNFYPADKQEVLVHGD